MAHGIDTTAVRQAIERAEKRTSGELRVHVESRVKGEVMDRAAQVFAKLHMHETEARNGVLLYLATEDRKFAIIGDAGINQVVEEGFWDEVYQAAFPLLANGQFTEALERAIDGVAVSLEAHFPWQESDVDELSNEVSVGA
jgi:uncharacterized membrane protein